MILAELSNLELDEWTGMAVESLGHTLPQEWHPTVNIAQCFNLIELFNVNIMCVPNKDLYQAKANGRVDDENAPVMYDVLRTKAICKAVIGFVFEERITKLEDMAKENQAIIDSLFTK